MFPLTAALAGSHAKPQIVESMCDGRERGKGKAKNGTALVYSQKAATLYDARAKSTLTSTKPRTNV